MNGGDRAKLIWCKHEACNNHIHHYGEVKTVYSAGINAGGQTTLAVGMRIANNLIHDAPHAGILYGGNDNILELNDIHHVCQISDDMGGLYSYHDWTSYGNVVRFNFIHDSPKAHGVYLDDGDSGDTVNGNIFYRIDTGVFIGGGHDNIAKGNLAIDCKAGIHIDARGVSRGYNLKNKNMVERVTSIHPELPPWSDRFPTLKTLLENHPELPTGDCFEDNVFVRCAKGIDRRGKPDELRFVKVGTNLEKNQDPGFRDPSKLDFRLPADSELFKLPGFKPIPQEKIGLIQDEYRR